MTIMNDIHQISDFVNDTIDNNHKRLLYLDIVSGNSCVISPQLTSLAIKLQPNDVLLNHYICCVRNFVDIILMLQVKGGVAEADGRLMPGDQILQVNNEDMRNSTQEQAAAILKVYFHIPSLR